MSWMCAYCSAFPGKTLSSTKVLHQILQRAAGIKYTHLPELGGLRHAHRDSINGAWRNASFREMLTTCKHRNSR